MVISYERLQEYLDAVAPNASVASHGRFWGIAYTDFVSGNVPQQRCSGLKIPIIDKADPTNSGFLGVLRPPPGFCGKPRMPLDGPFLDATFSTTLADGTTVTGSQILADIEEWLATGFPEAPGR